VGDVRSAFGRRVRELRTKRGLSQEQLAARADLHWTYVSSIERGRRDPGLRTVARLATALGVPLSDLVHGLTPTPPKVRGKKP
jgi:transcriptional regulator with XRE-family HTH domain